MTNSMFPSSLSLISIPQDHVIENGQSLKVEVESSRQWWAQGLMDSSTGKESSCNAGDLGSIPGLGTSLGVGHGNPLQYSCLENPHRQRSQISYSPSGYSPSGRNELDMTE